MRSKFSFGCLLILAVITLPVLAFAVPVEPSTPAEAHETEIKIIQELNDAVAQLDGQISEQREMLAKSADAKERNMIKAQIKTLEKNKGTLEHLVGELTGELTVKGVPVKELLAEQLHEKRDRLDQENERMVTEKREVEVAEGL